MRSDDTLLIVAVMIGAALVFGMLFAAFIAYFVFGRSRRLGRRWGAMAKQLGLKLELSRPQQDAALGRLMAKGPPEPPDIKQRMVGKRGGQPVVVGVRSELQGGGDDGTVVYFTYAEVPIAPPLQVGLSVSASAMSARLWTSVGLGEGLELGDPELDRAYKIGAADPEHARQLLASAQLREALLKARGRRWAPTLRDESVRLERAGLELKATTIAQKLDAALGLARAVNSAQATLPPPRLRQILGGRWAPVARSRGLRIDIDYGLMVGRLYGFETQVEVALNDGRFWTIFTVTFDQPLGVGLSLLRQGSLSGIGKILGAQDIEVGDPEFDQRFTVKGHPEEAVRELLTPKVCKLFLKLQEQATQLVVQDDRISAELDWLVQEEEHLEGGIDLLNKAAAALHSRVQALGGPYRG